MLIMVPLLCLLRLPRVCVCVCTYVRFSVRCKFDIAKPVCIVMLHPGRGEMWLRKIWLAKWCITPNDCANSRPPAGSRFGLVWLGQFYTQLRIGQDRQANFACIWRRKRPFRGCTRLYQASPLTCECRQSGTLWKWCYILWNVLNYDEYSGV